MTVTPEQLELWKSEAEYAVSVYEAADVKLQTHLYDVDNQRRILTLIAALKAKDALIKDLEVIIDERRTYTQELAADYKAKIEAKGKRIAELEG